MCPPGDHSGLCHGAPRHQPLEVHRCSGEQSLNLHLAATTKLSTVHAVLLFGVGADVLTHMLTTIKQAAATPGLRAQLHLFDHQHLPASRDDSIPCAGATFRLQRAICTAALSN